MRLPGACRTPALSVLFVALAHAAGAGESAEAIFPDAGVTQVVVSPRGEWIAARARRGDDSLVIVQRVGLPSLVSIATAKEIGQVAWEAPETLVIEATTPGGLYSVLAVRLSVVAGKITAHHRNIPTRGRLVDPLPLVPEEVLWLFPGEASTSLHRISLDELIDYNRLYRDSGKTIDIAEKLAVVDGPSSHWVVQRDGTPRALLRYGEQGAALILAARSGGRLATVHRFRIEDKEKGIYPVGLTPDESGVLVLAYKGLDKLGLYQWDAEAAGAGAPVFVHPDYDLEAVLSDPLTGDLVAVAYDEDGDRRYHYLEEYRDRFLSKLPEAWRRDSIAILNGTADRQVFAFFERSATNPGDYLIRDRGGRVHRVGRYGENVEREKLAPVESFRVKSRDGVEIEAFLALPRKSGGPAPLVVMPHGGPHSVRDSLQYDPLVQYLASWGFAVLQVNYRGSSGYGLDFEGLGKKQWARGIEDDIDSAVEYVMDLPSVDRDRICIVGGSYGGFSAFASVIRHADRYRCAVSINGVSDIPLLYDSSDVADSAQSIAFYEEYVGDLETERGELLAVSPAYHVRELETPTLVVQGTDDRRVDPDHAHRMVLMFELYGKPHELLELEGAEHSFERDEWIIVARAVRRFLTTHLTPEVPFVPDP